MIGITERGDAAIDYSWVRKLDSVDSTETYPPTAVFPAGYQTGTNFVPIPIYKKEETYVLILIPIHAPAQRTANR